MLNANPSLSRLNILPAVAVSASIVTLLVATECVLVTCLWPGAWHNPLGSQITAFALSEHDELGTFVLADNGDGADLAARRYRVGFISIGHGAPRGDLVSLPSVPTSVIPRVGHAGVFIGCRDGTIVYVDHQTSSSDPAFFDRHMDGQLTSLLYAEASRMVIGTGEMFTAWQADTGKLVWQRQIPRARATAIDAGGQRLYCGLVSGEILQIDPGTGQLQGVCAVPGAGVLRIAVSPYGDYLACLVETGNVVMIRLADGATLWSCPASMSCEPAFLRNGRQMVVADATTQRQLLILDVRSGELRGSLGMHAGVVGIRTSADGLVYSWGHDGRIVAWELEHRRQLWQSRPAHDVAARPTEVAIARKLTL